MFNLALWSVLTNRLLLQFPFFGVTMYDKLGFDWASSLVGFIALALAVVPWGLIACASLLSARLVSHSIH